MRSNIGDKRQSEPVHVPWAVELAAAVLCKRWKHGILWLLLFGKSRFGELAEGLPGITAKVLAQQLRELQRDGLIRREIDRHRSRFAHYGLSEIGRDLASLLQRFGDVGTSLPANHPDRSSQARIIAPHPNATAE